MLARQDLVGVVHAACVCESARPRLRLPRPGFRRRAPLDRFPSGYIRYIRAVILSAGGATSCREAADAPRSRRTLRFQLTLGVAPCMTTSALSRAQFFCCVAERSQGRRFLAFILTLDAASSRCILESGTKRNVVYSASFHRCRFLLLSRPRLLASRNSSSSMVTLFRFHQPCIRSGTTP